MKRSPFLILLALFLAGLGAFQPIPALAADGVVGSGTPASCSETAFSNVLAAVESSGGGTITFNCGSAPHTILFSSYKSISMPVVIDGGRRITLDGGSNTSPSFRSFSAPT
jgi:hypothetical protein